MYWLAIERDLVSLETLRTDLPAGLSSQEVLSALQSLRRRSLVERGEQGATFTLQPEVMAYVSERLVEQVYEEIVQTSPRLFPADERMVRRWRRNPHPPGLAEAGARHVGSAPSA